MLHLLNLIKCVFIQPFNPGQKDQSPLSERSCAILQVSESFVQNIWKKKRFDVNFKSQTNLPLSNSSTDTIQQTIICKKWKMWKNDHTIVAYPLPEYHPLKYVEALKNCWTNS